MGTQIASHEVEHATAAARPALWTRYGRRRWLYAVGGFSLLVVAGIWYYLHGRVTTDDAQVDGHLTPIAPRIAGTVADVLVRDNQFVRAGQVLVRIDPRDYQAAVDRAQAALALAEAQAQAARVGVQLTRGTTSSSIGAARAQVEAARAEYERARLAFQIASTSGLAYARAQVAKRQAEADRARADLHRMEPLLAKQEISQQQYDAFLAAARTADSDLEAARQQLRQAEQQVELTRAAMQAAQASLTAAQARLSEALANTEQVPMRRADASSAEAAVAQARAALAAAQLQLSYATIVAPVDGVVTKKAVEPGQVVQPGEVLLMLVPLQDVWVVANFKETQLARVHPGQRASVRVDMYGKTFTGHVDSIAGATGSRLSLLPPENATGNFVKVVQRIPVKIVLDPIPPEQAVLRPGMNVEATIYLR
jgi:membrane fusion protein (multidrug efflux system)